MYSEKNWKPLILLNKLWTPEWDLDGNVRVILETVEFKSIYLVVTIKATRKSTSI